MSISLYSIILVLSGGCMVGCHRIAGAAGNESHLPSEKKSALNLHSEVVSGIWGNETGGLIASLSAEKRQFRPGEPILISFQLKNVSEQPQVVFHSGFWPNHRLSVKDARGYNIPLTALGKETRAVFGSDTPRRKNFAVTLAPDQIDTSYGPYNLRDYFQIDDSATLYVRCLYAQGSVQVSSNELIIEVR